MVIFHEVFVELLKAGAPIESIETKFLNLFNIFEGFIKAKKPFDKLEIDIAVKETIQAMEQWELQNPEDATQWTYDDEDFYSIKRKYENLLDIEWTFLKKRTVYPYLTP